MTVSCSYSASAQDAANGVVRMRRTVSNDDVESYAHHLPKKEIKLKKKEDMVYKRGVLRSAKGKADVQLMQTVGMNDLGAKFLSASEH